MPQLAPNFADPQVRSLYSEGKAWAEPARYWDLERHDRIFDGRQYEGRAPFTDRDTPIEMRAPSVVIPLARIATQRVVSFVFGEGRFPVATVGNGGSELTGIDLSPEQAQIITQGAASVVSLAKLKLRMREGHEMGEACGTACGIVSLRSGKLCVDWVRAKHCAPEFDEYETDKVRRLTIRYRHKSETLVDQQGQPIDVWYRRVIGDPRVETGIDGQERIIGYWDICWDDVPVDPNGREPAWVLWKPKHKFKLAFVPVVWVRNDPDPGVPGIDGRPLVCGLENECEALDRTTSQRDRNALYNGDPQMILVGASRADLEGDPMAGLQMPQSLEGTHSGEGPGFWGKLWQRARFLAGAGGGGIKGGAGTIWAVKPEQGSGDAKILESTGAGATILKEHAADLRARILEALGVVIINPDVASTQISGAALRNILAPMLAKCDGRRDVWGEAYLRILGMCLRMLTTPDAWETDPITRQPTGRCAIRGLPNAVQLLSVLRLFQRPTMDTEGAVYTEWFDPPFALEWGSYLEESWQDRLACVQTLVAAVEGGVATKRSAIQLGAATLGIEDVEQELEALDTGEQQKNASAANLLSHVMSQGAPQMNAGNPAQQKVPE